MSLRDLFLSEDQRFGVLNTDFNIDSKHTPINPNLLSYTSIKSIIRSDSQLLHLKSLWSANIGRNGFKIVVNRELTEKSKERIQKQTKALLFSDSINFDTLENEIIETLFDEGNAILMLNNEGKVVCHSPSRFKIYQDPLNKVNRYTLIYKGKEVEGYTDMLHGQQIYHIKDPLFESWAVAPSRINLLYLYLILEHSAVKSNIKLFQNGAINVTLLGLDGIASTVNFDQPNYIDGKKNEDGLSYLDLVKKTIKDVIVGADNANGIQAITGLKDVFELGKDNKSMQFVEIIKDIAPEKKAWAYSCVLADLGAGGNTTYNNTQTFSYALYDKVGAKTERAIAKAVSNWILKQYNIDTAYLSEYYYEYNEPSDPDWVAKRTEARNDWINNTITLNQYLERIEEPPVEYGDVYKAEWEILLANGLLPGSLVDQPDQPDQNETDQPNENPPVENSKKKTIGNSSTPTSRAIKSKEGKKIEKKLQKAIEKQVTTWAKSLKSIPKKVNLPKITEFYTVDQFRDDLLPFVALSSKEVKKTLKKSKFKNADSEDSVFVTDYPDYILQALYERAFFVLEGGKLKADVSELSDSLFKDTKTFAGIDEKTSDIISTFVSAMADQPLSTIVESLVTEVSDLSRYRASLIASTEISNALEGSRYMMYKQETDGQIKMEWSTIIDGNQGDDHEMNDGEIRQIGEDYPSGEQRPGQRPNCRCTTIAVV